MIDPKNQPAWDPSALSRRYDGPLAPCPFCASSAIGVFEHAYAHEFSFVCTDCGAHGSRRATPEDAAEAWNQRG